MQDMRRPGNHSAARSQGESQRRSYKRCAMPARAAQDVRSYGSPRTAVHSSRFPNRSGIRGAQLACDGDHRERLLAIALCVAADRALGERLDLLP
jgi:hypothetical protein